MSTEDEYVPQAGDWFVFDRPPGSGSRKVILQVTGHDPVAGITTFGSDPAYPVPGMSAQEMADRGARKLPPPISPADFTPDWANAGRRLTRDGGGDKWKIYQLSLARLAGQWLMRGADDEAALALAQRAAADADAPVVIARAGSGHLVIGGIDAISEVSEGLGAQTLLEIQPGLPGDSGCMTVRETRQLLGSERARHAVAAALAQLQEVPDSDERAAADAVLHAVSALLPAEKENPGTMAGWQYRPELTPPRLMRDDDES
jgi:hypothetical protein